MVGSLLGEVAADALAGGVTYDERAGGTYGAGHIDENLSSGARGAGILILGIEAHREQYSERLRELDVLEVR